MDDSSKRFVSDEECSSEDDSQEARQGRRAAGQPQQAEDQDGMVNSGTLDLSNMGNHTIPNDEGPPRPSRRQGGWADDTPASGSAKDKKKGKRDDDTVVESGESMRNEGFGTSEDDEEIPIIPDLDEVQEEDMATQIAAPPSVQVNRVATYRELDTDFQRHAAFSTLDGEIDLKLLTNILSPDSEVYEDDRAWEWDKLFTEVASELQVEWERNKVVEKEQDETS